MAADFEFYEADAPPPVAPAGHRRRARWLPLLTRIAPVCWLTAAVLLLVAPFQTVYAQPGIGAAGLPTTVRHDGWGRISNGGGQPHGPRFGIALYVGAALLLLAALAWALARRHPGRRRLGWLGLAGGGVLAGVVGSAALYLQSVAAAGAPVSGWTAYAPITSDGPQTIVMSGSGYSSTLSIAFTGPVLRLGPACWLTLVALGVALLGAGISWAARWSGPPESP